MIDFKENYEAYKRLVDSGFLIRCENLKAGSGYLNTLSFHILGAGLDDKSRSDNDDLLVLADNELVIGYFSGNAENFTQIVILTI